MHKRILSFINPNCGSLFLLSIKMPFYELREEFPAGSHINKLVE